MHRNRIGRIAILLGASAILAACQDGTGRQSTQRAPLIGTGPAQMVEREVEAPDVFQVSEAGLWDGRPSLGGIWVAHPDATDPERVIIRNTENGKSVVGALFRRERENPGPRIQVSSEAAAAIALLAGKPTELSVTALRVEEVPVAPPPAPEPEPEPEIAAEAATAEEAPAPAPRKARQARKTKAAAPAAIAPPAEIEAEPLAAAAAAIDRAEAGAAETASPAPAPRPQTAPKPKMSADAVMVPGNAAQEAPARTASNLARPYVQVGLFNVESYAKEAAEKLRKDGIVPSVRSGTNAGETTWRVLVGPSTSEDERAALIEKIRALGYRDAYPVAE